MGIADLKPQISFLWAGWKQYYENINLEDREQSTSPEDPGKELLKPELPGLESVDEAIKLSQVQNWAPDPLFLWYQKTGVKPFPSKF